jgi:hypothetical protein
MKNMIKRISLVFTLALFSQLAVGQTEIYGAWDVHCALNRSGDDGVSFCALCTMEKSDTAVTVHGFSLEVDSSHIRIGGSMDKISYIRRPNGKAITFVKDKQPYSLTILPTTANDFVILQSSDGSILILQRKKEKDGSE